MKHRVIEGADGLYYPQCKPGLLRRWRMYSKNADASALMLERTMTTFDPEAAARFDTPSDAEAFIARVSRRVEDYWANKAEQKRRELEGVEVRRVVSKECSGNE